MVMKHLCYNIPTIYVSNGLSNTTDCYCLQRTIDNNKIKRYQMKYNLQLSCINSDLDKLYAFKKKKSINILY